MNDLVKSETDRLYPKKKTKKKKQKQTDGTVQLRAGLLHLVNKNLSINDCNTWNTEDFTSSCLTEEHKYLIKIIITEFYYCCEISTC